MADKIRVSTENLLNWAKELSGIQQALSGSASRLSGIDLPQEAGSDLNFDLNISFNGGYGISANRIADAVSALSGASRKIGARSELLSSNIRQSAASFADTESKLKSLFEQLESISDLNFTEDASILIPHIPGYQPLFPWTAPVFSVFSALKKLYEQLITNPFDEWGLYGGNQGSPRNNFANHEKFKEIIERNTGRELSDAELQTYLNRMNNEGCGYVAICNAIFAAFQGRPDAFREAFGFDMYSGTDLNYDELFVDLYSSWDNRSASGEFDPFQDYNSKSDPARSEYSYWNDATGSGTNINWRSEIAVQYLADHGINATSESHSPSVLTADMYNRMVSEGTVQDGQLQIRISGSPAYLRDANGNVVSTFNGGHAMTVTGTTGSGSNAMLIVSSWGRTYYVDPNSFCASDAGGNATGSMGYMVLRIDA